MATSTKGDVLQQLRDGIAQLTDSEAWRRYLDVQRRFHRYSWGNCMLIAMQRPDATFIAGYRRWQDFGRQVRKGERGIKILAPVVYRQKTDGEDAREVPDSSSDLRVVSGFRTVSVFDISQTDGEALPEIVSRLLGHEPIHAFRKMQTVSSQLGYSVEITPLRGTRNGECDFDERKIRLRDDLEPAHLVKTLAHEIGHVLLHHPTERPVDLPRDTAELEAESVAYVMCHELGIDSSTYSFGYIAHWAGGGERAVKEIEQSASRINRAARVVLDGLQSPITIEKSLLEAIPGVGSVERLPDEISGSISMKRNAWPEPIHQVSQVFPVKSQDAHKPNPAHRGAELRQGVE